MWVGFALALVGLADGLKMALKRHIVTCPNGTYFPQGTTNFNCYVHPNAGTGIAIAVISALLGILVALSTISAGCGPSERLNRTWRLGRGSAGFLLTCHRQVYAALIDRRCRLAAGPGVRVASGG